MIRYNKFDYVSTPPEPIQYRLYFYAKLVATGWQMVVFERFQSWVDFEIGLTKPFVRWWILVVNWLICPKSAPVAVSKTDNVKIIAPEVNQFADAWDVDYRKYHDLFIPDNKKAAIAVSVAG